MENLFKAIVDKNSTIKVSKQNCIQIYPPTISTKNSIRLFEKILENLINKENIYNKFGFNLLPVIYEDLFWLYCFHYTKYKSFFDEYADKRVIFKLQHQWQLNSFERKNRLFIGDGFLAIIKLSVKKFRFLLWLILNIILNNRNKIWISSSLIHDFRYDFLNSKKDADFIIIDIHGEITSEKMALGHFLDGKVTTVVGTHTHVPTADTKILKNGTAYQTDLGMCGDYDSVIGMNKENSIKKFKKGFCEWD